MYKRDEHKNEYYVVPKEFTSSEQEVKFSKGNSHLPYPYQLQVGDTIVCFDYQGMKELIEAALRVM